MHINDLPGPITLKLYLVADDGKYIVRSYANIPLDGTWYMKLKDAACQHLHMLTPSSRVSDEV